MNWTSSIFKTFLSKNNQENEKSIHRMGEDICKSISDKVFVFSIKNPYNSLRRQTNLKKGQRILTDIVLSKVEKPPIDIPLVMRETNQYHSE